MTKLSFKEYWYFLKYDILHYCEATLLFLILNLVCNFSLQNLIYALFESSTFYVSFWYIRVKFSNTYHSDDWRSCCKYTKTMLNLGIIVLWLLPIKYSLFNGLFVAVGCCLILYLVANEVDEKKSYKNPIKNIYTMSADELYEHCRNRGLDEGECKIAHCIIIDRLKGKELYDAIDYSERQTKRKRQQILNKIK